MFILLQLTKALSQCLPRLIVCILCLSIVLDSTAIPALEPTTATHVTPPAIVVELAGINRAYDEVKTAFELAGDPQGYQVLKDMVDLFLGGVDRQQPCEYRLFALPAGLQGVVSLPVKTTADYGTFLQYLWDVDVKTAPVPKPGLNGHVPASVRAKIQSLKLQSGERIVFSLIDGIVRHDAGYAHYGSTVEAVRLASGSSGICAKGATLSVCVEGNSASVEQRRAAFQKSSQKGLEELIQGKDVSDSEFALQKALFEAQSGRLNVLLAESSQIRMDLLTADKQKQLTITAEVTPVAGTSLAADLDRIGQSTDSFAGVPRQNAVLACSFNIPVNKSLSTMRNQVVHSVRKVLLERLEKSSNTDAAQRASDVEFTGFLCDLADDSVAMTDWNGCIRIWSNSNGSLTTVGAWRVADGARVEEHLRKVTQQTAGSLTVGESQVSLHTLQLHHFHHNYPELTDTDGNLWIAIDGDRVWYALGDNARERLNTMLQAAAGKPGVRSAVAFDLQVHLKPLSRTWNQIHSRYYPAAVKKRDNRVAKGDRPQETKWESIISDLNLSQLAADAYEKGQDTLTVSIRRDGERARLVTELDTGTVRYFGMVLSKFVNTYFN